MTDVILVGMAVRSILRHKMRALLTVLGIVIGVAAVIVMISVGQGAQSSIEQQIKSLGTNMIVVTPGATNQGGISQGAQSFNRLTVEDYLKIKRESLLLSAVSPVIFSGAQVVGGLGNWRTRLNGVSTEYPITRDWPVSAGNFFGESDEQAKRKVVVLGNTVADMLFPGASPIGQQVLLRHVPFTVVGVLTPKGQNAGGQDQDDVVIIPYTTAQSRFSGAQFIGQIIASAGSADAIAAAQEEVRAIMRESHRLGGADDDFSVRNQDDLANAATGTTRVMSILLAAIASISLLVGGIGIMNIMLVSVTERTREIGVRLAVGARGSDVMRQFLVESIVVSVIGGFIGAALGMISALILRQSTGWSTTISFGTIVIAVGFSAAIGIFFGFYPARRAAALNPIEALRYE